MSTGIGQPKKGCVTLRLRSFQKSATVTNRHDVTFPEGFESSINTAVKVADLAGVYFVNSTSIARCPPCTEKTAVTLLVTALHQPNVNEMLTELTGSL